jgi:hypothetical protein
MMRMSRWCQGRSQDDGEEVEVTITNDTKTPNFQGSIDFDKQVKVRNILKGRGLCRSRGESRVSLHFAR